MKRAFVTGGSGFTGSYLVKALLDKGYTVKALVRKESSKKNLEMLGVDLSAVEFVEGDLADLESLKNKIEDVDIVYHIAALYRSEGVPTRLFHRVNVDGTRVLLDESIKAGVRRFVHCSTVGVQGEIANPPATEDAPYNPGDHYQDSKLEGEKLALSYFHDKKIDGVVVRPVGIYGPGDTRFLKLFKPIYRGKFRMIGKGEALYHMTFVEDLVQGIILAGETPDASGRIYTIGGNEYLPLKDLVAEIASVMDKPVSKFKIPLWPVWIAACLCEFLCRPLKIEPPLYRRRLDFFTKDRAFDISRAKKELNYAPQVPLKVGLARTAKWYEENGYF